MSSITHSPGTGLVSKRPLIRVRVRVLPLNPIIAWNVAARVARTGLYECKYSNTWYYSNTRYVRVQVQYEYSNYLVLVLYSNNNNDNTLLTILRVQAAHDYESLQLYCTRSQISEISEITN